jgi:arylsulfatase A-like enzyme
MRNRDENLAPFPRTPERVRKEIAAYYGMVSEVDFQIGRILSALEKTGRSKDTIVVFAGDNGLAVGQHGLVGKQNLYEHSIRVPLVITGPGIPVNQRIAAPAYLHDLFPTLFDLVGLPVPSTVESRSLAPLLTNPEAPLRESTFHAFRHLHRAVRTDGWKLIRYNINGVHTTQLFDLKNDPWERFNRAGESGQMGRLRELDAMLRRWTRVTDDYVDLDRHDWGGVTLGEGQ